MSFFAHASHRRPAPYLLSAAALAVTLFSDLSFSGCARRPALPTEPVSATVAPGPSHDVKTEKKVEATYYGNNDGFAGKKTASGEVFNPEELTAAHRSLPFGTKVAVENPETGKEVEVKINDRGPYSGKAQLDLSYKAAKELGITKDGKAAVKMKVLDKPQKSSASGSPASAAPRANDGAKP